MKVSIITVVFNSQATIKDAISSVLNQTYKNLEYIIVDGGSTDGTLDRVGQYGNKISKIISEPDKGIYDAMNKGIKLASGDVIGILNSDDIYADGGVIENVVNKMNDTGAALCYGDLVYVDKDNTEKVIRNWKSGIYNEESFKKGWMPPHPTVFVKRWVYEKYGVFNLSLPIASDFEILFRLMGKHKIESCYIPRVLVKMRLGGESNKSIFNVIKQNLVIMRILKENKIRISPFFLFSKIKDKLKQFWS